MKRILTISTIIGLIASVLGGCNRNKDNNDVWNGAIAIYNMANLNDSTPDNSVLTPFGAVATGIRLEGDELKASLLRGGDGYAAKLNGGWLDAGQGLNDELKLTGSTITYAIRACDPQGIWIGPLMGKHGNDADIAYSVHGDGKHSGEIIMRTGLGSDEIAGMHRMKAIVNANVPGAWHDIVVRFDGKTSQFFVDGNLCDDEVTVGTIRSNNNNPFIIGAEYKDGEYTIDNPVRDEQIESSFEGMIDHIAIWNRALTDEEIAKLSGVTVLGDKRPDYYSEKYRPQFHFTPKKSWMNDPNGLVFYNGIYHMCYQHMPPGRPGAYKDWGQAISTDLVHWEQLTSALTPHEIWGGCWSGSAVIDIHNTTGLQSGNEPPIIAILTNGGVPGVGPLCTQCIAYSNDNGMTFTYYDKNPVLDHIVGENRDPKVIWYPPTKQWIMALYLSGNDYGLFASADMKSWEQLCILNLPGVIECPDLFEIPVDGNPANKKWVFWGANGNYLIGSFDGLKFIPESDLLKADYGNNFYAAQTWSNIPEKDGRRIQIAWMADGVFGAKVVKNLNLPWDQQMNFPTEVTLRTTPEGIKMYRQPVKEIELLREKENKWVDVTLLPGENLFKELSGELFEIHAEIDPMHSISFDIMIRGEQVHYDCVNQTLSCLGKSTQLPTENGRIKLQILVDRTSLEVFGNDGYAVLTSCFLPLQDNKKLATVATGGEVKILSAEVYSLHSIWQKAK